MTTARQQKRLEAQRKIIQHFEEKIPYFTDIFDERTFYISFAFLVIICILIAIFFSICCKVTIEDADELNKQKEERKRLKKRKLAEKLLKKKLAKVGIDPNSFDGVKKRKMEKLLERLTQNEQKSESEQDTEIEHLIQFENEKYNESNGGKQEEKHD